MTHEEMRLIKIVFVCAILLTSAFVYLLVSTPQKKDLFEVWITNSQGSIMEPALIISSNQSFSMSLGVQNMMGRLEYCKLSVKFRSVSPTVSSIDVSNQSAYVSSFQFFLLDNEKWAKDFVFKVDGVFENNALKIRGVEIDGSYVEMNITSFDYAGNVFFGQLKFELWAFNSSSNDFSFTSVWVSSPLLNLII